MSFVSKKLRNSARGKDCQVRIPGVCNFNPETTVLAHVAKGGMGQKGNDYHATFCCSACHDAIDGRIKTQYSSMELREMATEGMMRTQEIWQSQELLKIA